MTLKELVPWRWGSLRHSNEGDRPLQAFRREMGALHREMDRLFEDLWHGTGRSSLLPESWSGDGWPGVDETEDDKGYHIAVELPGMDEKDVAVIQASFKKGVLTVDLPKTEEAKKRAKRVEVKGA